ncbi:type II toxin-antitoxin system death-on-curing family toxin [Limnovirga soli]|jgi:death-on-curing protein|uniref:Type II toxin-antitoxin system death-on-curing family toxin n=1 Tax=Limnovirga soli TaxID=2656915 RepID=A0A8J8FED0_9BACT|nr:type II toxin-antitoxin system death-on-curing family toxin [Limnovirga soli]NNV56170.1 type II toxin-antitoxin system death-on-curing family toxin [Limnovirga soli]
MISLKEVEEIHQILIAEFGGANGIRDKALLLSALARPLQTFDGKYLYPTAVEKAASLIESILINHPFVDGNKRTGYVLMRLVLLSNNYDIKASQAEKYTFVIDIASGKLKFDAIVKWLNTQLVKAKD